MKAYKGFDKGLKCREETYSPFRGITNMFDIARAMLGA